MLGLTPESQSQYDKDRREATSNQLQLAALLQEAAGAKRVAGEMPAPVYLRQAMTLTKDYDLGEKAVEYIEGGF